MEDVSNNAARNPSHRQHCRHAPSLSVVGFCEPTREGAFYDRIRKGSEFSLVLRHRQAQLWPLSRDPVFMDIAEDWFSNLDKVNPLIEVYERNQSIK